MIVSGELHSFRTALVCELLNRTVFTYQHGPHFRVARLQEIGQLLGVLGLLGRTVATVPLYHFGKGRFQLPSQLIARALLQDAHNLPADDDLIVEQPVQVLTVVSMHGLRPIEHHHGNDQPRR